MESPAPFDLNQHLQEWRTKLSEAALISKDQLDELEDHVRTSFARLQSKGLSPDEAFFLAIRRVGNCRALGREYLKINPQRLVAAYFFRTFIRQKWILLCCSAAGLAAAAIFFFSCALPYQSEAKLFVRYVMENSTPGLPGGDTKAVSPDQGGETIINTEVAILSSIDLAYQVVDAIGVDKILDKSKGTIKDRDHAVIEVESDLTVQHLPGSGVIVLTFAHQDPTIPQPALNALEEAYLKKHVEVHRGAGSIGDFLSQETDQLRSRLQQTEDELRKTQDRAGITSLADSQATIATQMDKIREQIFAAESEYAERRATLDDLSKSLPSAGQSGVSAPAQSGTQAEEPAASGADVRELRTERAGLVGLRSKIDQLNSELDEVKKEALKVDSLSGTIEELQRQKELDETNYKYYSTHLEATRIDEALGSGHALNIARVQEPTPPHQDTLGFYKNCLWIGLIGPALGIIWALMNEFFLKRMLRRLDDDDFSAGGFRDPVPARQI